MASRLSSLLRSYISLPLLVCLCGSAIAVYALFLPAPQFAAADAEPAAGAAEVRIAAFAFSNSGVLAPGTEVTVINDDSAPHTLTSVDGAFDTGLLQPGEQVTIVIPDTPGDFDFFCEVHPAMTGTFTVTA